MRAFGWQSCRTFALQLYMLQLEQSENRSATAGQQHQLHRRGAGRGPHLHGGHRGALAERAPLELHHPSLAAYCLCAHIQQYNVPSTLQQLESLRRRQHASKAAVGSPPGRQRRQAQPQARRHRDGGVVSAASQRHHRARCAHSGGGDCTHRKVKHQQKQQQRRQQLMSSSHHRGKEQAGKKAGRQAGWLAGWQAGERRVLPTPTHLLPGPTAPQAAAGPPPGPQRQTPRRPPPPARLPPAN